ncbi:DUF2398 family protein [Streptomyces griseoincarnatus]
MSTLANQLAAVEREQVARAIRLLLARPLLTEATDPAGFELVRRRREPLAQWFDYTCGWSLVVEPRRGYARLTKVRADPDGSRPARRARFRPGPVRPPAVRPAVRDRRRAAVAADDHHRHARRPCGAGHVGRPGTDRVTGLVRERRYGGAVTDGTADDANGERAATDAQRNLRL